MKHRLTWIILSCLTLFGPPFLAAQTFRGGIQGHVSDTTGAVLPGTRITATHVGTKLVRSAVTDAAGAYYLSELPTGEYTVSAALQGFSTRTVKGVMVEVSASTRVNIELSVGGTQENVEVVATVPLVDTTHNTQGGTISGEQAAELPLNGRDFTRLLGLVAGSSVDPAGMNDSPGSFGLFSSNGSRGRSNNYLIDGTDMNDGYRNLPAINEPGVFGTPATILPVDAVEEFPILSGAEAEYGRNSGAIVNIVTKSGTNDLRGSVYEYYRNDALNARNYFNTKPNPKDSFSNHQFGVSLGGPIIKDKTFFFIAYEGQREEVGLPTLTRVPTQQEIDASVAANGGTVNPVIAQLLARNPWPTPNRDPDASGNNLETKTIGKNDVDSVILKVDHHMGDSDVLTARYFYGKSDQSFPLALLGGGSLPGYNTITPTKVHVLSTSFTKVLSSKLLAELRAGYNRFSQGFFPEDQDFDPNSIGLNTVSDPKDFGLPYMRVTGYAPIGSNLSLPRDRLDINYHLVGNVSYNTGRHNWKAGYEFRRTTVDGYFDAGYRGRLDFSNLDDFIAGRVSGGRQARGNSDRVTSQNSHGLYLQDTYKASRNLTFNLGLRWDYYGVISEKDGRFSIFDEKTATVKQVDQLYPKDWNNISPRLSAAWDIRGDGKTVLRAGWGLYYDAFSQDYFVGQLPWNTFNPGPAYNDVEFTFSPTGQLASGQPVFEGFGATDVFTVDQKMKTPMIHNFNVNIQQQLGSHMAVQIGYVGSRGKNLFRYRDLNQLNPDGSAPYPDYVYINQFESTAESRYNALQATVKVLAWHGLSSTINYTYGKSVDTASDGMDFVPNAAQPDDSRHPEMEEAPSNYDQRHRFSWYFTWEIGKPEGHWLLSGWSVNGVVTLASGMPINLNYLYEGDFNGSGEWFGRPDVVGDPKTGTGDPSRFLDLSAFRAPCDPDGAGGCAGNQHFGDLKRNAYYALSYKNVDLSLVKNTSLGKRVKLQIRLDVFNLFNHPNFANPMLPNFSIDCFQNGIDPATNRGIGYLALNATPDVAAGNPVLGGGGPRNIQLAARISF